MNTWLQINPILQEITGDKKKYNENLKSNIQLKH